MIKAKKKIETTVTLEMDAEHTTQLDMWLVWAMAVWQQIQKYPMLQDEIFNNLQMGDIPATEDLNYDRNVTIRLALKNAEVTEV